MADTPVLEAGAFGVGVQVPPPADLFILFKLGYANI
jgi:hypothetical protein